MGVDRNYALCVEWAMQDPTPIAKIIDSIGASTLQRAFGHENASTVSSWKIRGSIPVEYWPKIIEVADEAGKEGIDYAALVAACAARKNEQMA